MGGIVAMSSTINASTASGGGVITTADASGILQLQTAGVTALTIDASQNVTFANPPAIVGTNLTGTANSLNAGLGVNQTWQGVVRVNGTTYTNSSGKPIMCVYSYTGGATLYGKFTISGSLIPSSINGSATTYTFTSTVIVPNGATYVFNTNGTLAEAWELR